jgi:hypothetical protein
VHSIGYDAIGLAPVTGVDRERMADDFRLNPELKRLTLGDYQLPLGVRETKLSPPSQGYTVRFQEGKNDEPDTFLFHAVVSHERLKPLIDAAFNLLPKEVTPVVEIGSRDAYRMVDVYLGEEPMPLVEFLRTWYEFEEILLEDVTIGVGANAEEPWVDVFIDTWKGVVISIPVEMREEVEDMLHKLGIQEVETTWSEQSDPMDEEELVSENVLDLSDNRPDLEELLLELRERWFLELNIDRETNVDEAGRHLGMTLWHAVVLATASDGQEGLGANVVLWMTAGSLAQAEELIEDALLDHPELVFESIYTMDRVAYDDRPQSLSHIPPTRRRAAVHEMIIEPWGGAPPEAPGGRANDN